MSDYVSIKGKLKEVYTGIKGFNNKFNQMLSDNDISFQFEEEQELAVYYAIIYDHNLEDFYFIKDKKIYEIQEVKKLDEDIFHMNKSSKNQYQFVLSYYNGGCSFQEAISDAFDNMKKGE